MRECHLTHGDIKETYHSGNYRNDGNKWCKKYHGYENFVVFAANKTDQHYNVVNAVTCRRTTPRVQPNGVHVEKRFTTYQIRKMLWPQPFIKCALENRFAIKIQVEPQSSTSIEEMRTLLMIGSARNIQDASEVIDDILFRDGMLATKELKTHLRLYRSSLLCETEHVPLVIGKEGVHMKNIEKQVGDRARNGVRIRFNNETAYFEIAATEQALVQMAEGLVKKKINEVKEKNKQII